MRTDRQAPDIAQQFTGTWRLVSFELRTAEGKVSYPMGEDARGLLIYDGNGRMSVQISRKSRPLSSSDDPLAGDTMPLGSVAEGYIAYFGSYRIDPDENTVTHVPEGSLLANWVGTSQTRLFEFSNGDLILSTPPLLLAGSQQIARLIWRRP